jgi:heat-inducible transcriptional repressor
MEPDVPARPRVELSARDREILKDVVHTFLLSGVPVSSRAVAKHSRHGVSAATIRNVMADLEELGFLGQPHTSAGRVPTAPGLHLYIESLMEARDLPAEERRQIEGELAGSAGDTGQLIDTATQLLSRLSGQIGILVTPAFGDTVLRAVDFVPLSGRRLLCVVVSKTGFVENKLIETDEELSREELVRISNYLTESFRGQTLRAIREQLLTRMSEERAQVDALLARAIRLARLGLEPRVDPDVVIQGTSSLLAHPELGDIERVRRMLDAFAERQRLVALLSQCLDGNGVRVVIGEDDEVTSDLGLTLVARSWGADDGARGTLGILGPARMPYERIIPLVDYLGESLGRALEESANR